MTKINVWGRHYCLLIALLLLSACVTSPAPGYRPAPVNAETPRVYVAGNEYHIGFIFDTRFLAPALWPDFADYMQYRFIEVSWTDKAYSIAALDKYPGFFTELKTILVKSDAALVVSAFDRRPAYFIERNRGRREWRAIAVSDDQLVALLQFVDSKLAKGPDGKPRAAAGTFYGHGAMFDAVGEYSLANLCGDWVNSLLAIVDIPPAPATTLYPASLMRHVRKYTVAYEPDRDL